MTFNIPSLLFLLINLQCLAGVHVYTTWDKNSLKVCFSNGDKQAGTSSWKEEDKDYVQRVVESEFSKKETGVYFTGFQNCKEATYQSDIIIYAKSALKRIFTSSVGSSTLGRSLVMMKGYRGAYGRIELYTSKLNYSTIVHEFGHSAGLAHEQDHYDAHKIDSECSDTSSKTKKVFHYLYTTYDSESVMNYCFIHTKQGRQAGLSEGDKSLLRKMYVEKYHRKLAI